MYILHNMKFCSILGNTQIHVYAAQRCSISYPLFDFGIGPDLDFGTLSFISHNYSTSSLLKKGDRMNPSLFEEQKGQYCNEKSAGQ